jgi:hypothetical protein
VRHEERPSSPLRDPRPARLAVGVLFIAAGLLVNEWTVKCLVHADVLGPFARLIVWACSMTSILWGVLTIRFRRHAGIQNVGLVLISGTAAILCVELLLQAFPTLLGHPFANGILTKYSTRPDGIYHSDPRLRMNFMIPNYTTTMYYNGYVWEHRTDSLGFRNSSVRIPADLVLLGDSFIYGHGVNLESTVGHFLERCAGASVMNLARQADNAFDEAYLMTEYIGMFRPKVVLYFFFENDIRGVHNRRTPAELKAFVEASMEAIAFPPRTPPELLLKRREEAGRTRSLLASIRQASYIAKVWDWLKFRRSLVSDAQEAYEQDEESLEWKFTKKAILYMRHLADRHGARFVMAPITPTDRRHYAILSNLAREHGIEFVNTSAITVVADRSLFLVEDGQSGHFSEKGAHEMAMTVCEYLQRG